MNWEEFQTANPIAVDVFLADLKGAGEAFEEAEQRTFRAKINSEDGGIEISYAFADGGGEFGGTWIFEGGCWVGV